MFYATCGNICDKYQAVHHYAANRHTVYGATTINELLKCINYCKWLKISDWTERNLKRPIPSYIGKLDKLRGIWMSDNPLIGGTLPDSFENMTDLTVL